MTPPGGDGTQYALTEMRNGAVRAECHVADCYWWADFETKGEAMSQLTRHMHTHRVQVTRRKAESTSS